MYPLAVMKKPNEQEDKKIEIDISRLIKIEDTVISMSNKDRLAITRTASKIPELNNHSILLYDDCDWVIVNDGTGNLLVPLRKK